MQKIEVLNNKIKKNTYKNAAVNRRSVAQFCRVLELVGRSKGGRGGGSVREDEVGDPRREGRESVSVTHSIAQLSILLQQHMWRRVF